MAERTRAQKKQGGALQTVLNIFGVILCVVFIPIIIINVVMIVRSYTDPEHIPSVFGVSPVIVLSGSMSPEFEAGDMIFIQKTDPDTLQVDDVICFLEEESAITHRIIEIQRQDGQTLFVTQGDANNAEDATPVTADQIQGKYTGFYVSGLGEFAMFLQSTPGMLIFIGGPILAFLLWDILRRMVLSRQSEKENRKLQAESSTREQELAAMEEELRRLRAQAGQGPAQAGGAARTGGAVTQAGQGTARINTASVPGTSPAERAFHSAEGDFVSEVRYDDPPERTAPAELQNTPDSGDAE